MDVPCVTGLRHCRDIFSVRDVSRQCGPTTSKGAFSRARRVRPQIGEGLRRFANAGHSNVSLASDS